MPDIDKIIAHLNLTKHGEGGYFYETYRSKESAINNEGHDRSRMTSIYYLLTKECSLSYFVVNKSDLVLYYHLGDPLKIIFLTPEGKMREEILGTDICAGERPQIICPAGIWKAYDLMGGSFALVGEAVGPGFDYADMKILKAQEVQQQYPEWDTQYNKYVQA